MIKQQAEFKKWNIGLVKGPLLVFFLVILLGFAISFLIYQRYLEAQNKNATLESRYRQVQMDRRETESLVKKVGEYHSRYAELRSRGYFQSDAKINWLEVIGEVAQDVGLDSVDYSIGSAMVEAVSNFDSAGLLIESIPVTLQIKLLHEVDLLKMLDQVSQKDIGLVGKEGCVIEKISEEIRLDSLDYAFNASCDLKGYVIQFGSELGV